MISDRAISLIGLRVQMTYFSTGTFFGWNRSTQKFENPNNFWIFQMVYGFIGGTSYALILALDMYLKLVAEDIPSETGADEKDPFYFATFIIQIGEMMTQLVISFLAFTCVMKLDDFIYLTNQLFVYNGTVLELLKSKEIELDETHQKNMKQLELLIIIAFLFSFILPFGLAAIILHPVEPTHQVIESWLEIKVEAGWVYFPFFLLVGLLLQGCAGIVVILSWNIACYYILATTCLDDLTPIQISERQNSKRCKVITKFYGEMEDHKVSEMYRIQRLFNELMNDFYKSLLISYHHVGSLVTSCTLICFAIRFWEILSAEGVLACAIVIGSIMVAMGLLLLQSIMCGRLVDISDEFKDVATKLVERRSLLAKFARSCDTFFIQVVYPFYTIRRETFLLFCGQVVDYVITLLLW
ncbi:unnamed protein product [Orchesella dallaii]|uniref:Odorant receptor n=1 Tax=Orchesella dallaii TaxID=48710 RepID=A0ABP1S949_9HEXA